MYLTPIVSQADSLGNIIYSIFPSFQVDVSIHMALNFGNNN